MPITINGSPIQPIPSMKKKSGHTEPQSPMFSLNDPGHKVRVATFQWYMGQMSHSAFHAQRKKGRVPTPDGFDPRPFWWSETVAHFFGHRHTIIPRALSKSVCRNAAIGPM